VYWPAGGLAALQQQQQPAAAAAEPASRVAMSPATGSLAASFKRCLACEPEAQ